MAYEELQGTEQRAEDHPDNSQTYKMAGDVTPIRPSGSPANLLGAVAQGLNEQSLKRAGEAIKQGKDSGMSTSNLKSYYSK